jgi:hypothetical protein
MLASQTDLVVDVPFLQGHMRRQRQQLEQGYACHTVSYGDDRIRKLQSDGPVIIEIETDLHRYDSVCDDLPISPTGDSHQQVRFWTVLINCDHHVCS